MINRRVFLRFWISVIAILCIIQIGFSKKTISHPINKEPNFIYQIDTMIYGNDTLLTVVGRPDSSVINEYYRTNSGFYVDKNMLKIAEEEARIIREKHNMKQTVFDSIVIAQL